MTAEIVCSCGDVITPGTLSATGCVLSVTGWMCGICARDAPAEPGASMTASVDIDDRVRVRVRERVGCIVALEVLVREWRHPHYLGKPTELKQDRDTLRSAIHKLYARCETVDERDRVMLLVEADPVLRCCSRSRRPCARRAKEKP